MEQNRKIGSACIVIPTYNEADNIESILNVIYPNSQQNCPLHVLVVDDNSPDGTADIVKRLQKKHPYVHLLFRENKEGLGAAYIAGIKYAMKHIRPDLIIEMDADFSHDPKTVYRLIANIRSGNDFVIGSRYVSGGSIPDNWGLHRRTISFCANLMTQLLLGIKGVKDSSGGFRAIHIDILRRINFDAVTVKGYAFQAVFLEEAIHHGAIVREIPIEFRERESGKSKMTIKDMLEGFSAFTKVRLYRLTNTV